jgi:hypothetical protein
MSTIEKCLNPKCKKDGNAAFEGYCSNRCKMQSKARNWSPEEVAQMQAEIDTRDSLRNSNSAAAATPNSMTIQETQAIRAQKISDLINGKASSSTVGRPNNITFPKTAIISITTHGSIELNGTADNLNPDVIPQFTINPKITQFYKYNAVAPGVINFISGTEEIPIRDIERSNSKKIENLFADNGDGSKINRAVRDVLNLHTDRTLINKGIPQVLDTIKNEVNKQMEETIDGKKTEKTELEKKKIRAPGTFTEDDNESLQMATEYVNQFNKGQNIYDCITGNPQRKMVNKTYTLQEGNHASGEDWTISCLNFDFSKENIFDLIDGGLAGKHHIDRKITLEQIVNYLAGNGVENLIIIDLTCCPFFIKDKDGDIVELIDRSARQLRNWILKDMKYGGRTRNSKRRINTKRRRNSKKRRTSKRRN